MAAKKNAVKINSLELENVKRVKAVAITPTENGLTVLGGKNAQGKTSVLDAIAWALGGDRYKPSAPDREGSMVKPHLKVSLSNGVVVVKEYPRFVDVIAHFEKNGGKWYHEAINKAAVTAGDCYFLKLPKD